jgi:glycine cleavage system H protein
MSKIPTDLKYAKTHEWAKLLPDGSITVGISDHAQELLGDMVFVELPKVGVELAAGKECAVVESVKAASDVYAPVAGKVVEVNGAVVDAPEKMNKDPYGDGWMFRLQPKSAGDINALLDAKGYAAMVAAEKH